MRSKKPHPMSWRPSEKNKSFLEQVGIIDGRTGKRVKSKTEDRENLGAKLNYVLNLALTTYFETGKHAAMAAPPAWMLKATHLRQLIKQREAEIRELSEGLKILYAKLERIPGLDPEWLEQQDRFDLEARKRREERESRPRLPVYVRAQRRLAPSPEAPVRVPVVAANPNHGIGRYINNPGRIESTDEGHEPTSG